MPALRTATKVLAVIVGMGAAGFAFLLACYEYDRYRLRDRLEHLDATLPSVRLVKDSCSPGATCQCHILTHRDVFQRVQHHRRSSGALDSLYGRVF